MKQSLPRSIINAKEYYLKFFYASVANACLSINEGENVRRCLFIFKKYILEK